MNGRQFVDTNILMYAHDVSAGIKHRRAKALIEEFWRTRSGVVSTQVLQELCVNLRRKARHPLGIKATRDLIANYLSWHVAVNTGESILEAVVRGLYGIPMRKALTIGRITEAQRQFYCKGENRTEFRL